MTTKCLYAKRIYSAVRQIAHAVDTYSRKLGAIYDLTVPQLVALQCIHDHGPLTSSEISRHIHLSTSTLVGVLDRLEGKGLITRIRLDSDRRKVMISATAKGETLADAAPSPMDEMLSGELATLSEDEKVLLTEGVEKLVDLIARK